LPVGAAPVDEGEVGGSGWIDEQVGHLHVGVDEALGHRSRGKRCQTLQPAEKPACFERREPAILGALLDEEARVGQAVGPASCAVGWGLIFHTEM